MNKQIRVTLGPAEQALLTAVQQQMQLNTQQAALLYVLGTFIETRTTITIQQDLPIEPIVIVEKQVEQVVPALTLVPSEIPDISALSTAFCDGSLVDVNGREYFKTEETCRALREKGHTIVDAITLEAAIRTQDFTDNPPKLTF